MSDTSIVSQPELAATPEPAERPLAANGKPLRQSRLGLLAAFLGIVGFAAALAVVVTSEMRMEEIAFHTSSPAREVVAVWASRLSLIVPPAAAVVGLLALLLRRKRSLHAGSWIGVVLGAWVAVPILIYRLLILLGYRI